jgi:hypothetical protein
LIIHVSGIWTRSDFPDAHTLAEEEDVFRRILGTDAKIDMVQFSLGCMQE